MVCGIDLSTILELIGHDGSEEAHLLLEEPYCRKGFYPEEIEEALKKEGYQFDGEGESNKAVLLLHSKGHGHAVAVIDGVIYDPEGGNSYDTKYLEYGYRFLV